MSVILDVDVQTQNDKRQSHVSLLGKMLECAYLCHGAENHVESG